jgi:PAS domain S-box-containing protein
LFKQFNKFNDKNGIDFSISSLTLAFQDRSIETRFQESYFESNLQLGRACHFIAIFFFCLVGIWDTFVIDPSHLHIWISVATPVALIFLIGLVSSYLSFKNYSRYWRQLFSFYVLMTGAGFTVVTVLSSPNYPIYNFVGIIFCLLFCYSFIRLTFIWATASGNVILALYIGCIWIFVGPPTKLLMTELFYLSGINLLGMMICYSLEILSRRDFMLNYLLEIEQNNMKRMNTRLEQKVEERTKELKLSEATFSGFFNQGNIGMAITSLDKGWVNVNKKLCNMLGYSKDELIRMSWTEMTYPDDLEPDLVLLKKMMSGEIEDYEIEKRFFKKDKAVIYTHLTVSCIRQFDNTIDTVLATLQDITKRKSLESQLIQAQKMESIGRLAGGVAHDYNNALTTIMGFTELAMMDADPAGPLHADLNQVLKAGRRAQDITRQLLAFARKQTIAPRVLDMNETVESMLKMLRRLIGEDIDFVWLPGTNLWNVKVDPSQIDQILANLCVNAKDAIKGVGKITIETATKVLDSDYCTDHVGFVPGQFIQLSVSDNGCGMDKGMLKEIFEPFFTTKDVDKGTGLGLSMVYGIVKQNNGFINVYSEPGKGTTIKIYLPRNEDKAFEIHEESTEQITQGRGETILVVEDDPPVLKLAQKILEGLNYKVLIAGTPKGAIELAKEHKDKIHLLITDVIMPEMNGNELSEHLQSLFPDLKCIFMSGYTANAIAHQGVLDEGVQFVQKPFSKNDLATIVRKVLDGE